MATLPLTDQEKIWKGLMRFCSAVGINISVPKDDLLTAVQSTDSWIDSNQASYNQALPVSIQSLSLLFKTLLFCAVAIMRIEGYGETFLRRILGGID